MPAVREVHAEIGIAGSERRIERGMICVSAAVRLNVGMLRAEQRFRALDSESFHLVDVLATAVVPLAGIALGVLIGQVRACRREHRGRNEVFARDKLYLRALTAELFFNARRNFGIGLFDDVEFHYVLLYGSFVGCPSDPTVLSLALATIVGSMPFRRL